MNKGSCQGWRRWIAAGLVGLVPAAAALADDGSSSASEGGMSGWLQQQKIAATARVDEFHLEHRLDDASDSMLASLEVKALPKLTDSLDGLFDLRPSFTNNRVQSGGFPPIREAYLTQHFAHADLSLGRQILIWGRADGINPTDNITPHDYITLLPFDDDQRFGVWGLRYTQYFSEEISLTGFASPFFEPNRLPKLEMPNEPLYPKPARNIDNSTIAFKLDRTGSDVDASLSYYRGLNQTPAARLLGSNTMGPQLEFHYDRMEIIGADLARSFGHYGFRGEMAYRRPLEADDGKAASSSPDVFGIFSVDRTVDDNLNIEAQAFWVWVQDYRDPAAIADPTQRSVATSNAIYHYEQDRNNGGFTLRFDKKWFGDALEADVMAVYNLPRHDYYSRSYVSYAFNDHWKATAGYVLFAGSSETYFGGERDHTRCFVELKYVF